MIHADPSEDPLRDSRVHVHVEDGRYFLQTTDRRFDLITGEPPPPHLSGIVNLYTREYFEQMRGRLAEGGIASYWLPVHSLHVVEAQAIVAAFCAAFEDCSLWGGSWLDWILVGTRGDATPGTAAGFQWLWAHQRSGSDLRAIGGELPEQLGALFMRGPDALREFAREVPPLDDDHPKRLSVSLDPRSARIAGRVYKAMMDPVRARDRFAHSAYVERWWPPELREASLPFFGLQARIEAIFAGGAVPPGRRIRSLHDLMEGSDLRTLALWTLGSDDLLLRAAKAARARGLEDPDIAFHLGAAALAERDFAAAAVWFERAGGGKIDADLVLQARIYALVRADRPDAARAEVERAGLAERKDPATRAFLVFARTKLGL